MKSKSIQIKYQMFNTLSELDSTEQMLVEKARQAMDKAYAPYSHFHVGAALLLDDDTVIEGNNQENAAYPSGLCAERVALFYAGAIYPDKTIKKIAIIAAKEHAKTGTSIVSPCGACRQVFVETETRQKEGISIILVSPSGNGVIFDSVRQLMPFAFDISKLLSDE